MAELLKLARKEILGKIAHMAILNADTLGVVSFHCDSETQKDFFLNEILHKSWFYLICQANVLDFSMLQDKILNLKHKESNINLIKIETIKQNLYFLLAKIATCKESVQTKMTYLQQVRTVFDFKNEELA